LQSRIDSEVRAIEHDCNFIGRISNVQHIAELIIFTGLPTSRRRFCANHFAGRSMEGQSGAPRLVGFNLLDRPEKNFS
jgi:hypothetical protein